MKKTIALSAISAMALTGFAYSEIESSFNVGYNSTYVWRGLDLGDSMYQYGLDFGGSCDCGLDWSAGIWYANPADAGSNDELDIYAEVSKDLGFGTIAVGFIHYEFDEENNLLPGIAVVPTDDVGLDNTEVYIALGTSFGGLDLGAAYYHVVDGSIGNPSWAELSASYGYEVSDKLSASLGLSLGSTVDTDGGNSYVNYNATLGLDYAVSEQISFAPYLAYNTSTGLDGGDFDGLYGGAVVTFSF